MFIEKGETKKVMNKLYWFKVNFIYFKVGEYKRKKKEEREKKEVGGRQRFD